MSRTFRLVLVSLVLSATTAGATPLKMLTSEPKREVNSLAEAWERFISWLVQVPSPPGPALSAIAGADGSAMDPNGGGPH